MTLMDVSNLVKQPLTLDVAIFFYSIN